MADDKQIGGRHLDPGDLVLIPRKLTLKERFLAWLRFPQHIPPRYAMCIGKIKKAPPTEADGAK